MIAPTIPDNERERLDALYAYGILDTEQESDFDELVLLASKICQVPISLITLIDSDRQWFKAKTGMEGTETPRELAFCAHAIHQDTMLVVPDATRDVRFEGNPFVTGESHIRFYAGMPLTTPTGYKLGTLCVIDSVPRTLTADQSQALEILGRHAMKLMELRRRNAEMKRLAELHKRLLAIIGHDLRSPLNTVRGMLSLLEEGDLGPDEFKDLASDLGMSVDTTTALLNNLLEWASSQLNERKVYRKPIPIRKLTDHLAIQLQPVFQVKGNRIDNRIDASHIGIGDRHMTEFILRNLLMNANKFMEGGIVTLASTLDAGRLRIRITDEGTGIEPWILDKLFDWNEKTTTLGSKGEKGSGFGLPMSREFALSMGGTLTVLHSGVDGTTFELTLPSA